MASVPKKAAERIVAGLKQFQPILAAAKSRDINESDTALLVTDMLQAIFGYDKYAEVTSEHMIRSTFCDLAIKLDGQLSMLIEVKAIGLDLKEQFVKQAVDYAANQGCEWVSLTNGCIWRVYRVTFGKPIEHELVVEIDMPALNHRNSDHVEQIGLLSKEGWQKARLGDYHAQRQALSRFTLAALMLSEPILDALRREVRRVSPEVRVEAEELVLVLRDEVLKRDVIEGDKAEEAKRRVARAAARSLKSRSREPVPSQPPTATPPAGDPSEPPLAAVKAPIAPGS
jgi:predicted type IV restriction endonuclease